MKNNQQINNYKIVKKLGGGGFGQVFLAVENITGEYRAIKKLISSESDQSDIIHEIQQVAKLKLSNTVSYFHHFWDSSRLYFVMEYCSGGNFREHAQASNFGKEKTLDWIRVLALCLNEVHKKGIVHKDIKPDNLLFDGDGNPKIGDFGMANRFGGTTAYMSPAALMREEESNNDPREDVYSLGVTLMEILVGTNPFFRKSTAEIIEMHRSLDFPIGHLPFWQQSIILKAIHQYAELRFQNMSEFAEAIVSKQVPYVFKKEILDAGLLADKIQKLTGTKRWMKAQPLVEYGKEKYPDSVNIHEAAGEFYLKRNFIDKARISFERAINLNSRLNVQRQLGEIQLEFNNFPKAISLLSDHLHRIPNDLDAQNLLLKCFILTGRYEAGMELASELLKLFPDNAFLKNNQYLCDVLFHAAKNKMTVSYAAPDQRNSFLEYNWKVLFTGTKDSIHGWTSKPHIKTKLLFMESRFDPNNLVGKANSELHIIDSNIPSLAGQTFTKNIITIGRDGYLFNDITVPGGNAVSRLHALLVNQKNDIWLYDLASFSGTMVNGEQVKSKVQLIGVNKIEIGKYWFRVSEDRGRLF